MPSKDYNALRITGLSNSSKIHSSELDMAGQVDWDEMPGTDFIIDGQKYAVCKKVAHLLKKSYPLTGLNPKVKADYDEIVQREQKITETLMKFINNGYGEYNEAIAKGADSLTHSTMHKDIERSNGDKPARLTEFKENELICRHFAPIFSALAAEAGMATLHVGGLSNGFSVKDGHIVLDKSAANGSSNHHAFVVSRLTGNVIETTAHKDSVAYKIKVNDISVEDFIAGKTIIAARDEINFDTYGTGWFEEKIQKGIFAERKEMILSSQFDALPSHDYSRLHLTHQEYQKQKKLLPGQINDYDLKLVSDHYRERTQPLLKRLAKTIEKDNVADFEACCKALPASHYKLASIVGQSIREQKHMPIIESAIEQGALKGFDPELKKAALPFMVNPKETPVNKKFTQALIKKLDLDPVEYFQEAVKYRWADHVQIGVENFWTAPKTEELQNLMLDAAEKLDGYRAAKPVILFLNKHYGMSRRTGLLEPTLPPQDRTPASDTGSLKLALEKGFTILRRDDPATAVPPPTPIYMEHSRARNRG